MAGRFSIERPGSRGSPSLDPSHPSLICGNAAKSFRIIVLHYRSQTTRSNRAKKAWRTWAALAWLFMSGSQSNAERDLVARDRRLQEDQLYAMQDYISQYQQLVCRIRSENASLRRQ